MSIPKIGTSRASGRPHQSLNQESLFFENSDLLADISAQRNRPCSGYGRQFFQVSLLCLMLVCLRGTSWCQAEGATLQGTVSDPTGAVIPHATVSITNEATGAIRNSETNVAGIYSAQNLAAGSYRVVATATGFHERKIAGMVLTVGAVRNVDITLSLGANTTQVDVTAAGGYSAPAVDTASSSIQGIVDDKTVRELPLNGRDWTSLAALQPGVSQIFNLSGDIATGSARTNRGLASQLTIGGNRPQQNNYRLDGISVNDYANGGPGSALGATLGVDAVQERICSMGRYTNFCATASLMRAISLTVPPSLRSAEISLAALLAVRSSGTRRSSSPTMKGSGRASVSARLRLCPRLPPGKAA